MPSDKTKFTIPDEFRGFREANLDERCRIAKRFVENFVENMAPPKNLDGDKEWTRSVRGRFIEICPEDCYPWPSDKLTRKGEYLVDFGWAENRGGHRVLLACECEWGSTRYGTRWWPVEHDFEKLLAVKAPFKLLIFSSNFKLSSPDGAPDADFSIEYAKQRLEASLHGYGHNIPGETYILLDFPRGYAEGSNGIYRAFTWIAKKYGDIAVSLDSLANGKLIRPSDN